MTVKLINSGFILLLVIVFSGFFSCSRSEPRIVHGFMELVYYSGRDGIEERITFFVLSEDDDGIENLAELYLYHDREGLRWSIGSEDWVNHTEEGVTWIGSRSIAIQGAPLPRGVYRAVLVNKSGERSERNFTFDTPQRSPYAFPSFSFSEESYTVRSQYPVNHFIFYDQQGRVVDVRTLSENEGLMSDLRPAVSVRTAALWAEDPELQISAMTEAAPIR